MPAPVRHVLGPDDGEAVHLLALGVRFMIDGATPGGAFSLVEHPLPPRALGSPVHTHANEDEYTYVLEGRVGVQLGNEVVEAGPGELVFKPRGVAHAFWNAGDEPARMLELISPAGFEKLLGGRVVDDLGAFGNPAHPVLSGLTGPSCLAEPAHVLS